MEILAVVGVDELVVGDDRDGMRQGAESIFDIEKAIGQLGERLDVVDLRNTNRDVVVAIEVDRLEIEVFDIAGDGAKSAPFSISQVFVELELRERHLFQTLFGQARSIFLQKILGGLERDNGRFQIHYNPSC